MSKHNRRRTRSAHKHPLPSRHTDSDTDGFDLPPHSLSDPPDHHPGPDHIGGQSINHLGHRRQNSDVFAQHWHNRYLAWQARAQRAQRDEEHQKQKLIRDKVWMFGGGEDEEGSEDGEEGEEEEELCGRMMEFFRGLDFLEL